MRKPVGFHVRFYRLVPGSLELNSNHINYCVLFLKMVLNNITYIIRPLKQFIQDTSVIFKECTSNNVKE